MGAEDSDGSGRYLVNLVNEASALVFQVFDNVLIVNDLMADKNRGVVFLKRTFDDRNGADHSCTKPTRLSQHDLHATCIASEFLHFGHPV